MYKLAQKLILLLALAIAFSALTLPSAKVRAAPVDCDAISALCRIASRIDYDICILKGGDPTDCAWKEAEQTINCIRSAGCNPQPKLPPDN